MRKMVQTCAISKRHISVTPLKSDCIPIMARCRKVFPWNEVLIRKSCDLSGLATVESHSHEETALPCIWIPRERMGERCAGPVRNKKVVLAFRRPRTWVTKKIKGIN